MGGQHRRSVKKKPAFKLQAHDPGTVRRIVGDKDHVVELSRFTQDDVLDHDYTQRPPQAFAGCQLPLCTHR